MGTRDGSNVQFTLQTYVEVVVLAGVGRWPRLALPAAEVTATAAAQATVTPGEDSEQAAEEL
jgi:hypothetical protein